MILLSIFLILLFSPSLWAEEEGQTQWELTTVPPGADISINGEYVGKSPVILTKSDSLILEVEAKKDNLVARRKIRLFEGKELTPLWLEKEKMD